MRRSFSDSSKRIRRATIRENLKRVRSVEHDRRVPSVWAITLIACVVCVIAGAPTLATFSPIAIALSGTIAIDIVYARRLNAELRAIDEGSREDRETQTGGADDV